MALSKKRGQDFFDENQEFTKESFEVSEELVEDFSYFYKDEEDVLANEKLKRRYRLFMGLIISAFVIISIFILGGVRMATYGTTEVVTETFIQEYEYKQTTETIYQYCLYFYDIDGKNGKLKDIQDNPNLILKEMEQISDKKTILDNLKNPISESNINKYMDYDNYKRELLNCLYEINLLLEEIKKEGYSGDVEENELLFNYIENYVETLETLVICHDNLYKKSRG